MIKIGKRGVYVVIEGLDLTGKSTITTEVVKRLEDSKEDHFGFSTVNIHHRREPSYTSNGLKMRNILASKKVLTPSDEIEAAQLMLLDRIENTTAITKLLRDGDIVIQERNFLTALAYDEQGDTKEVKFVQELNKVSLKPDLLIFITADLSVIFSRLSSRGDSLDAYENKDLIAKRKISYLDHKEYMDIIMPNNNTEEKEAIINYLVNYIKTQIFCY